VDKILVSVFDSEEAAFEGLTALKDLHGQGNITLYASAVIAKDANGEASVRKAADQGPIGTLVGVVGGGLVGLLGGPVGVAVGAYVGGFSGLMYDLFKAGISADFVDEVSATLTPGKTAVIAEVDEAWTTPVDTRLGALGATTLRRVPSDVVDQTLIAETAAARAELDELEAQLRRTSEADRAKVQAAIAAQREKFEALVSRIDSTLQQRKVEFEAKLATLRAQRQAAHEHQTARIDAAMTELKTSHAARQAKLEQARSLAKESAELTKEALVG
jgi:uncharacterized membrane protein